MFCTKCGNETTDNDLFCEKCGEKLKQNLENQNFPSTPKIYETLSKKQPEFLAKEKNKISSILFSFTGCSPRLHYWSVVPVTLVPILFFSFFINLELNRPEPDNVLILGVFTACAPFIWAYWAVRVKRCHDRNKSGLWVFFMGQIPIIGWLWELIELGFFPRKSEGNKYATTCQKVKPS